MLYINGNGSRIADEIRDMLDPDEGSMPLPTSRIPVSTGSRYLFCAGVLAGERIDEISAVGLADTWETNFALPAAAIETILKTDPLARIVVIGSESAITGSYDAAYAGAKAAMHRYVESRRVGPYQQLVCVSPSIIGDAGMTTRREDTETLEARRLAHPKQRFCTAREVASLVKYLLYEDATYITGVTIRINGGESATRQ